MNRFKYVTEEVKRTVANKYLHWKILLSDAMINSDGVHLIKKEGWDIKFIEGENSKGGFLEFYSIKSNRNDEHFRIYVNGDLEELEAIVDGYSYDETVPGDKDSKHTEYTENNKRIYNQLKEIGLYK